MKGKTTKKILAAVLVAAMSVSITACGSKESDDSGRKNPDSIRQENQGENNSVSKEQNVGETKTEYPLTVDSYDNNGEEITTVYEKAPEKVLAVYQGSIETLLALGLEDKLVGTAGLDNEVPDDMKAAFSKVNYLDEFTPSKETVTMLEPDMIFSWGSIFSDKKLGSAQTWIEKGVNTYINTNTRPKQGEIKHNKTLENEYKDLLTIGEIFDVQDKAQAIVNKMKNTVTQVLEATKDMKEKPTALILESGKDTFTNYGASSLGGDMLTQLGGKLANPDGADMGKEDIIAADPEIIFVVYMPYEGDDPEVVKAEKLKKIMEDPSLASLQAVKNGRVVPIMLSEMYASATRTQDGIIKMAKGLYPEINIKE